MLGAVQDDLYNFNGYDSPFLLKQTVLQSMLADHNNKQKLKKVISGAKPVYFDFSLKVGHLAVQYGKL